VTRSRAPAALLAAVLGGLAASGCADRSTPDFRGRPAEPGSVVVDVNSQHYADVTIYVTRDGSWQRLGSVTGNGSARLEIPSAIATIGGQYRFRVHAIGTPDDTDYVSDRIMANQGDVIALTIAPLLSMSSWSVRE
jgi:hypothetical protein